MNILKSTMLVAGLGLASMANATTYDFSYTFGDGTLLSGSLSGTANGALIQNIANVRVELNGNAFGGAPLFAFGWNAATPGFNPATPAVLSVNAALNNFIFADNNDPTFAGVTEYFYFVNDPASLGHEAFATNLNTGAIALDNPDQLELVTGGSAGSRAWHFRAAASGARPRRCGGSPRPKALQRIAILVKT